MRRIALALTAAALTLSTFGGAVAGGAQGVLARCGPSKGQSYYFKDPVFNPNGPNWTEDGISNGKIILVRLGDEWDIQFDDFLGASGYRQQGAAVIPLSDDSGPLLTVGAFAGSYTEIYTFDMSQSEVVWTSHKTGTSIKKVAIYRSTCSFTSK